MAREVAYADPRLFREWASHLFGRENPDHAANPKFCTPAAAGRRWKRRWRNSPFRSVPRPDLAMVPDDKVIALQPNAARRRSSVTLPPAAVTTMTRGDIIAGRAEVGTISTRFATRAF